MRNLRSFALLRQALGGAALMSVAVAALWLALAYAAQPPAREARAAADTASARQAGAPAEAPAASSGVPDAAGQGGAGAAGRNVASVGVDLVASVSHGAFTFPGRIIYTIGVSSYGDVYSLGV